MRTVYREAYVDNMSECIDRILSQKAKTLPSCHSALQHVYRVSDNAGVTGLCEVACEKIVNISSVHSLPCPRCNSEGSDHSLQCAASGLYIRAFYFNLSVCD